MKVYYELFQSQSPGNETFEKVLDNVGRISVPDDFDVGNLIDAIYTREEPLVRHCSVTQLSAYPHGTDTKSPTLKQEGSNIDSDIPATTKETPLIITFPANESLITEDGAPHVFKQMQQQQPGKFSALLQ